jgi:hypothetical protein
VCLSAPTRPSKYEGFSNAGKAPNDSASVLADAIRSACIKAALLAYDDAGIRGLCHEGRWECALAAIRHLDLRGLTGLVDEREPTK